VLLAIADQIRFGYAACLPSQEAANTAGFLEATVFTVAQCGVGV
jgi:hypothetical protein